MTSQKRDREVELDNASATSTIPNKRIRLNTSGPAGHVLDYPNVYDSSLLIVWSQPMTKQQKSFLTGEMEEWVKLKSAANLIKSRSRGRTILDARKIKRHMDLSTIRGNLESDKYSAVRDFVLDFRLMVGNAFRTRSLAHEVSMAALQLFRIFCLVMRFCPTGPHNQQMATYSEDSMRLMASEIKVIPIKTTTSTPSTSVAIEDSDQSLADDAIKHFGALLEELQGQSSVDVSDSSSQMQIKPPRISGLRAAKMPEPDDADEEMRKLSKEIEERQQKFGKMVEKKRLSEEIKNLDTEKLAIEVEIPQTTEQIKKLHSKVKDCCKLIDSVRETSEAAVNSRERHNRESVRLSEESKRLKQESEMHRQENTKFSLAVGMYERKIAALQSERDEMSRESDEAENTNAQLKMRRDQIEGQRATAKKNLEELNNGGV
jgi:myosin heavy subunit